MEYLGLIYGAMVLPDVSKGEGAAEPGMMPIGANG
jgi:hypothetical protein